MHESWIAVNKRRYLTDKKIAIKKLNIICSHSTNKYIFKYNVIVYNTSLDRTVRSFVSTTDLEVS